MAMEWRKLFSMLKVLKVYRYCIIKFCFIYFLSTKLFNKTNAIINYFLKKIYEKKSSSDARNLRDHPQ